MCLNNVCSELSDPVEGTVSDALFAPIEDSEITTLELTTGNDVEITFTTQTDASFYKVLRKTDRYSTNESVYTAITSPYINTSTSYNQKYYYRVQACNPAGCSSPSAYEDITSGVSDSGQGELYYFAISRAEYRDNEFSVYVQRRGGYGARPAGVRLYYSLSKDGDKVLAAEYVGSYPYQFEFEPPTENIKYYLWVESCYERKLYILYFKPLFQGH